MAIDSTLLRSTPVSQVAAGLGLTTTDGGPGQGNYLLGQLQPELALRAVGVPQVGRGIDAPLRFQLGGDGTGTLRFRSEDYDLLVGGIAERAFSPVYQDGQVVDVLRRTASSPPSGRLALLRKARSGPRRAGTGSAGWTPEDSGSTPTSPLARREPPDARRTFGHPLPTRPMADHATTTDTETTPATGRTREERAASRRPPRRRSAA